MDLLYIVGTIVVLVCLAYTFFGSLTKVAKDIVNSKKVSVSLTLSPFFVPIVVIVVNCETTENAESGTNNSHHVHVQCESTIIYLFMNVL